MKSDQYIIVYSLQKVDGLELYLPIPYICLKDKDAQPSYPQAVALIENTESYGISYKSTIHETLIHLCQELNINELEKEFNRHKKKPEKLNALFADTKVTKLIRSLIDKRLNKFLQLAKDHQCFLCLNLARKVKAIDVRLVFSVESFSPDLKFIKTQTGIRYELSLKINGLKFLPSKKETIIIANDPAILLVNHQIISLEKIAAIKVKPFIKKEYIFIENKMVKTFFEQFLLDMMGKVDVDVEGFTLNKTSELTNQTLHFVYDLIENKWVIDIQFSYEQFTFFGSEINQRKTKIYFDKHDDIIVSQCTRDKNKETHLATSLEEIGLTKMYNGRYFNDESTLSTIETVAVHFPSLIKKFSIVQPEHQGKLLQLLQPKVETNFTLDNDWFDLKGYFKIGEELYPIANLFQNIRNDDRLFKLRDGTFVIIPKEMFATFLPIVKFGKEANGHWLLSKKHFTLLEKISDIQLTPNMSKVKKLSDEKIDYIPSKQLKATLRPYQVHGIEWLIQHRNNNMGACLADDMGLGKTIQTISLLLDAKENKVHESSPDTIGIQLDIFSNSYDSIRKPLSAMIILPASLVYNWQKEIKKYAPSLQVLNYTGNSRKKAIKTLRVFDVILTTYQTAVVDFELLKDFHFHYIVLDESQQIRNKNSKVFSTLRHLNADHRLTLSGTPIENSLADLWSQMEFINPDILGTYSFFKENYQTPIEKNRDESAIAELKTLVDPFILRRTKEQVAKDLPELIENIHYAEMTLEQKKLYESEKSAARNYILGLDKTDGKYKFHVLNTLMKLRQMANHPLICDENYTGESGKFDDVKDKISTIHKSGHKVLIFSSFISHLNLLAIWLQNEKIPYVSLTGAMSKNDRELSVIRFQESNDANVFLLSIKAGGTGLNLTKADYVFILDPWWNPFVEKQAIARAHRIGRLNNVMVTRFITTDTIEEKILRLQEKKKILSDDIIEIDEMPDSVFDKIQDLLK